VALRNVKTGWSRMDRQHYYSWFATRGRHPAEFEKWFEDVGMKPANGASFNNFIWNLLEDVASGLSEPEQLQFRDLIVEAARSWPTPPETRFADSAPCSQN
jgi:hypothetical protein